MHKCGGFWTKIVEEFYGLKHDGFDDNVGNFEYIVGGLLAEFDDIIGKC